MARIAGVNLPNKRIIIALTYIKGIGRSRAKNILEALNVDENTRANDLSEDQLNQIRGQVDSFVVEGDLKRLVLQNIRRLKEIKSYRGSRHDKGLPSRGQRTKTNNRTVRGNRRQTLGSGRVKVSKT